MNTRFRWIDAFFTLSIWLFHTTVCQNDDVSTDNSITLQGSVISLNASIEGCLVFHDGVPFAVLDKPCICRAKTTGSGLDAIWLDEDKGHILARGVDSASLYLKLDHVGSKIICRTKYMTVEGTPTALPPIAYGPTRVEISVDKPDQGYYYAIRDCPATVTFSCRVQKKSMFPQHSSVKANVLVKPDQSTLISHEISSNVDVDTVDYHDYYFDKKILYTEGNVSIQCRATNTVLGKLYTSEEAFVQVRGAARTKQKRSVNDHHPHKPLRKSQRVNQYSYNYNENVGVFPEAKIDGCTFLWSKIWHVDASKTCACRVENSEPDFIAEWVDHSTGLCLEHGEGVAFLKITPQVIEKNKVIFCRVKHGDSHGKEFQLPKIAYGPDQVELSLLNANSFDFYTSNECPQFLKFSCRLPINATSPKPNMSAKVVLTVQKETLTKLFRVPNRSSTEGTFFVYYFSAIVGNAGDLSVKCIANNSVLETNVKMDEKSLRSVESSLEPVITTVAPAFDSVLVFDKRDTIVICKAPWGKDKKMSLSIECGNFKHGEAGDNEVRLRMKGPLDTNGTLCKCIMQIQRCSAIGVTEKRIYPGDIEGEASGPVAEIPPPTSVEGDDNFNDTGSGTLGLVGETTQASNVEGDEDYDSNDGLYVGMGVGVSLGLVLVAVLFFFIGYKFGFKKSGKPEIKVSFKPSKSPKAPVQLEPSANYEDLPEREPLQEAYTDSKTVRPTSGDSYSHIDYTYAGDNDGQYEVATQGGKSKRPLPSPQPNSVKKKDGHTSDENFYDRPSIYDSPDRAANSVYNGYSKPLLIE